MNQRYAKQNFKTVISRNIADIKVMSNLKFLNYTKNMVGEKDDWVAKIRKEFGINIKDDKQKKL